MPVGFLARKFLAEVTRGKQRWSPAGGRTGKIQTRRSADLAQPVGSDCVLGMAATPMSAASKSDIEYSLQKIAADLRKDRAN
jgi:hypothetical protein